MKKLFTLLACCMFSFTAFCQSTHVAVVNSSGAAGSFTSGYTLAASGRTDGNIVVNSGASGPASRGYAVFNLAGLVPANSTIDSVYLRFNYTSTDTTTANFCDIYGYGGDLSVIAATATLYTDCGVGLVFCTNNWGASTTGGQKTLLLNASGRAFIQGNLAGMASICFANTAGNNIYTIVGEGGTTATQPQLIIKSHCTGVSGVSATVTPFPVCQGAAFSLHATAVGATTHTWSGPGGFSSTSLNPAPITALATVSGIYSFIATSALGCVTQIDSNIVVHPLPTPVITRTGAYLYTSNTYLSYAWTLNTINIPGDTTYHAMPTLNGNYRVLVTDSAGCSAISNVYLVGNLAVQSPTGPLAVNIYPVPASDLLHIDCDQPVNVELWAMDGSCALHAEHVNQVQTAALASGTYVIFVQGQDQQRIYQGKLVVKH